jgi:hypothetical protein
MDAPLLVFWGMVGFLLYIAAEALIRGTKDVKEFSQELNYVHTDLKGVIEQDVSRVVIRIVALIAWWLLMTFTLHSILPFSIGVAYMSAIDPTNLIYWVHTVGIALLLTLVLHALLVLMRLFFLRTRLFGDKISE